MDGFLFGCEQNNLGIKQLLAAPLLLEGQKGASGTRQPNTGLMRDFSLQIWVENGDNNQRQLFETRGVDELVQQKKNGGRENGENRENGQK